MKFYTDKQTLNDLGFSASAGKTSVKQLFNQSKTRGGIEFLDEIMTNPLSDGKAISQRISILDYFLSRKIDFPFQGMHLDAASTYLNNYDERTKLASQEINHDSALTKLLGVDSQTKLLIEGAKALLNVFAELRVFLATQDKNDPYFKKIFSDMDIVFTEFEGLKLPEQGQKVSFADLAVFDKYYRFEHRSQVLKVFYHIYELDAWISVATVARERGFVLPSVIENSEHLQLELEDMYHPLVPNAKGNSVRMGSDNVIFLTGANMAGKSTFMKSIGIVVYLAHLGFPVPASSMRFSVFEGIVSSINLSDNIDMGYSHFYAEVKRIRMVAQMLSQGHKLFVLFDELFRGTNVKDAYEGTVELTKAFAKRKDSGFVISTHIIEAADDLKAQSTGIQYVYLPTIMQGSKPKYTYTLTQGVTSDRHGMLIINNEGILDRLSSAAKNPVAIAPPSSFSSDEQTLKDLKLLGKFDPHSIFYLFNRTLTKGGERLLEKWFNAPLTDHQAINERAAQFEYFSQHGVDFALNSDDFSRFEGYITSLKPINKIVSTLSILVNKVSQQVFKDAKFDELKSNVLSSLQVIKTLEQYFTLQASIADGGAFKPEMDWAIQLIASFKKHGLGQYLAKEELSWKDISSADFLFGSRTSELLDLIDLVHKIDVYQSVAKVAKERGFIFAQAKAREEDILHIENGKHPKLKKGVGNTFHLQGDKNLIFLTGANMAGKSTYMKTASINLYLAHMGFPVAAEKMVFSVRQGLYTSINVSDSLQQGFSHYYAEVMRVKAIAEQVAQGKYLFVLFDELFKGTNVKDAFDATLAVTENFVLFKRTFFIISTHIVEVGERIAEQNDQVDFKFMPTIMQNNVPRYPYIAESGISADKHGMVIIHNEGILDLLK